MDARLLIGFVRDIQRRGNELLKSRVLVENKEVESAVQSAMEDISKFAAEIEQHSPFPHPQTHRDPSEERQVIEAVHMVFERSYDGVEDVVGSSRLKSEEETVRVPLGASGETALNWRPLFAYFHERFREIIAIYDRIYNRLKQNGSVAGILLFQTNIIVNMAKSCRDALEQLGYHDRLVNQIGDSRAENETVLAFSTWTADQFIG